MSSATQRENRRRRIRAKVTGTEERPRLAVFRSNKEVYAQLIDDAKGATLASSSSRSLNAKGGAREKAEAVAKDIAKKAKAAGITEVVFDRGGFLYAGVVRHLAEVARDEGLTF